MKIMKLEHAKINENDELMNKMTMMTMMNTLKMQNMMIMINTCEHAANYGN